MNEKNKNKENRDGDREKERARARARKGECYSSEIGINTAACNCGVHCQQNKEQCCID